MPAALRMIRKVAAQPGLAQHIVRETRPGLAAADDDALLDHVRKTGQTSYHPIGTCRMGNDVLLLWPMRACVSTASKDCACATRPSCPRWSAPTPTRHRS